MRIAFTTKGDQWDSKMDPRFGRAAYLLVYDEEKDNMEVYDNKSRADEHGVGPGTAKVLFDMKAEILVTGNGPGGNAASVLERAGVKIFTGAGHMRVKEAYENYKNNMLTKFN